MVWEVIDIKKLEVFVGDVRKELTGESLTVTTSTNANQPTALMIRDENEVIAEFAAWTYWHKLE